MDNEKFIELSKELAARQGEAYGPDNMYVVWVAKALQNNKGLFSSFELGAPYFEIIYNGDKEEFYVDTYVKSSNRAVKLSEVDDDKI
ncbi:hypothetical protein GPK34_01035 [Secundilactobacillus kimchicus]|uniref:DUF6275 family protein n=1 Tax=Secundilactobacillus kimchicus TaxID=528209 RepID=UPI001C035C5C|nr:DUF6275 family protein [Secundilactobacillus kimchicus]MBT9670622.1 hypothetical protein [Secundilactobacillus kimchicus]